MSECPQWALVLLAAMLGALTGICTVNVTEAYAAPPSAERLAHAISSVDSSARREGSLDAPLVARLIVRHCEGLDPYEVAALMWKESGFRFHAESTDGEDFGIFQLRRRWNPGIDALNPRAAILGGCAKLRRWRTDCARWRRLCLRVGTKKICTVHNPASHHFMSHWASGTSGRKTSGARKVALRAKTLRVIAEGAIE